MGSNHEITHDRSRVVICTRELDFRFGLAWLGLSIRDAANDVMLRARLDLIYPGYKES
jgi:hypothetical protein